MEIFFFQIRAALQQTKYGGTTTATNSTTTDEGRALVGIRVLSFVGALGKVSAIHDTLSHQDVESLWAERPRNIKIPLGQVCRRRAFCVLVLWPFAGVPAP